jgi:NDP-sugar pyrophosphorylase family protein
VESDLLFRSLLVSASLTSTTSLVRDEGVGVGAIVLAGSYGWGNTDAHQRLPPRPLAAVALRPLISYSLEWLWSGGATEIAVCANGSSSVLRQHLGDTFERTQLRYHDDLLPRGPAGCVRDAVAHVSASTIVVVEGSIVPRLSLPRLLAQHRQTGAAMTVVTTIADDSNDQRPAGIYVLQRSSVESIALSGFHDIKETLIPRLHRDGALVCAYTAEDESRRVTTLESYLAVNAWLVERIAAVRYPDFRRDDARPVADVSAAVDPSALIVGPVLIGTRATIAAGATIIGPAVVGDGSSVGSNALVSRSVVGRGCLVSAGAVVHGCVIGDGAAVAASAAVYRRLVVAKSSPSWFDRLRGRLRASSKEHPRIGGAGVVTPITSITHGIPSETVRPELL